ncbi:MAG: hypothetical protein U9Q79_03015, partial [Candidatus Hydrogenedentes bacterium]|nr:hypothetical protein [Candidatus Hydrogenedentota bacterium]
MLAIGGVLRLCFSVALVKESGYTFYRIFDGLIASYNDIGKFSGWNNKLLGHGLHKTRELLAHLSLRSGTFATVPRNAADQAVLERQI